MIKLLFESKEKLAPCSTVFQQSRASRPKGGKNELK